MSPRSVPARACALFLVAGLLAACAHHPAPAPAAPATAAAPAAVPAPHKLLLISIDGLRADALGPAAMPHLSRLADEGVRARWMNPSYPSLTFPNHYAIVTGLRPDRHGIVHNTMEDPVLGRFSLGDSAAVSEPRWWGGEPIWIGAENAGIRSATWAWPGSEAPILGRHPSIWQTFDGSVPADARVDTVLGWLGQSGPAAPRLLTLYFDQVDHAGHDHGPRSPEYARAVGEVDAAIGRLLDGMAGRHMLDTTDIVVVSDHGMAEVGADHVMALDAIVPADEARVVASGQSLAIAPLPGRAAAVEARLLGAHPHYDCWRKAELPARWHYGRNPRIPAIVCQMHEGWDAVSAKKRDARLDAGEVTGSHGYDPLLPSMRAVFVARGPSFRSGVELAPFDNVDVYPLLARLLGIAPAPNDGDIAPLLPALRAGAPAAP